MCTGIAIKKCVHLQTLNDKEYGKLNAEKELLEKMGVEDSHPEVGCCGMAGAFGYESANNHYEESVAAGERALLPLLRAAKEKELIIADGFSCQEQIQQQTNRSALHMAQVMQMAIRGQGPATRRPEAAIIARRKQAQQKGMAQAALVLGVGAAAALVGFYLWKNRRPVAPRLERTT